jgi:hypothetical protein
MSVVIGDSARTVAKHMSGLGIFVRKSDARHFSAAIATWHRHSAPRAQTICETFPATECVLALFATAARQIV